MKTYRFVFKHRVTLRTLSRFSDTLFSARSQPRELPDQWEPWECWDDATSKCVWHMSPSGECAYGPRPAPEQPSPIRLWMVTITHEGGNSVWVFSKREKVDELLAAWTRRRFKHGIPNGFGESNRLSDAELQELYWKKMAELGREHYQVHEAELDQAILL